MRSSATMPTTSVFSANQPSGRRTNVLAAPTAAATAEMVVATDRATSLSGIVSDSPAHSGPSPARSPGRSASPHSIFS